MRRPASYRKTVTLLAVCGGNTALSNLLHKNERGSATRF
jgi:hypothetical protein